MGLPQININFFGKMKTKNQRQAASIVALILKDGAQTKELIVYKPEDKITGWSEENTAYIEQALKGNPQAVIAVKVEEDAEDYSDGLRLLRYKRFEYLAIPGITEQEAQAVVTWVKDIRKEQKKKIKAILPNTAANHESIINFTAKDIEVGQTIYSATQYTARIAGILAGLPYERSATYFVLDEVVSAFEVEDPDAAIDAGELILVNDGKNIKIGRGVNSLVTISEADNKNDDFKSIRVMAILDRIHDEIYDNFNENYIGKVPNTYDNQVLFINQINRGFDELTALELLDGTSQNEAWVDVESQKLAWESVGVDTQDWDEAKTKNNAFKRNVFLAGKIRPVDTMEDLNFTIEI